MERPEFGLVLLASSHNRVMCHPEGAFFVTEDLYHVE